MLSSSHYCQVCPLKQASEGILKGLRNSGCLCVQLLLWKWTVSRVPEDGGERRKLLPWHQHFQFSGLLTCHMDHCRHSSDGLPAISVLSQIRTRHTQVPVLFFFLQLCLSVCLCIVTVQMCRWKCKWLGADLIKCFSLVRESFIASAVAFPWHFPRRSAMLWFKDFSHYFPCHLHFNHRNVLFARSNFLLTPRSTTERDPLRDTCVFLSSFRGSGVIFRLACSHMYQHTAGK